jgi:hypothetical protein
VAVVAFAAASLATLLGVSRMVSAHLWKETFQLNDPLVRFEPGSGEWSVAVPEKWRHTAKPLDEGEGRIHIFEPSDRAPVMYMTLAVFPRKKSTGFVNGGPGVSPETQASSSRGPQKSSPRLALESETYRVEGKGSTYVVTAAAGPRWFRLYRDSLNRMIHSLEIPNAPNATATIHPPQPR